MFFVKRVLRLTSFGKTFDFCGTNNTSSNVHDEMNDILNCIISNPDLNNMLKSPIVNLSDKSNVLGKVFVNTGKEVKALFKTLILNKRVDLLDEIASQYGQLYYKLNDKEQATVITAAAMTEALEKKIMNKLKTLSPFSKAIIANNKVTTQHTPYKTVLYGVRC